MLKSKNLNILTLSIIIFLIPFLEFIENNINEIDIVLGKSFYFLIIFTYLFIFLFSYLLNFFIKNINFSNSLLIFSMTFWILFKHNLINQLLRISFDSNFIGKTFSSEISLIIILTLILILSKLIIKGNFFFKRFYFIFFYLSFFFIIYQINFLKTDLLETDLNNKSSIKFIDQINSEKPNIYFFILDAMQPVNNFEKYYKTDLSKFLDEFDKKNYLYLNNTSNLYNNTTYSLSAIFHLDEIFKNEKLNIDSNVLFPNILRKNKKSNLISNLSNLGYNFKWIGNYFAYCPKFNLKYCLNQNQNKLIDTYLYISFFKKSPLIQIFTNIGYFINFDFNKYLFFDLHDGMGRLTQYVDNTKNLKKPTFYFIHHMSPHWPYVTNSDCSYKNYSGEENYEGYKSAYLCNLKKIGETIEILEKKDPNSFVVFQSDHNWQMSKNIKEKKMIFNLVKKKENCKYDKSINYNNVNTLRLILSCITGNVPRYINN